jgi:hypothetical protein
MTQQHPITPPPELVQQWEEQFEAGRSLYAMFEDIYRAGADAELEACCADLRMVLGPDQADWLRSVRRPKPPSLKEQALDDLHIAFDRGCLSEGQADTIRRALEQLPDNQ